MGVLYVIATPLGNLKDITFRSVETLNAVDFILCEDTRRALKLLSFYNIRKPLISYHQHSKTEKVNKILSLIEDGKDIALITDAGTPAISDPGGFLIELIVKRFGDDAEIVPIPGPSALTAMASISGFPVDKFLFLGFPPTKKRRSQFFNEIASSQYPVILYESMHRILKTMDDLIKINPKREVVVGRELTKKFETIYRGEVADVLDKIKKEPIKGEFTIIIR
ncbi:MAG: 16S rRNA (cytidine(1402)-2'-O)-methyltransferase [Minisyncoccales bacterium]|jgi:16S rRNA (cytidine1402-2'-O)-methyltransferase